MAQGRNFVTALMVGTASISTIVAGTTVPAVAQAATGSYRIESQPLSQALMQLSRQANVDIVAPAKIVRGRTAKAVAAESVDAALRQMLSGSGLTFKRGGSRYLIVAQGGNVDAAPARAEASASGSDVVAVPSASASTVIDARTGAALKGALVEIVETGEKTSTGNLGEFRFPRKTGSFNLRVSYLGYPVYEQFVDLKDGRATSGILLSDGSTVGEIVVTAMKSARAQALNQERTAPNMSTVISDDLTGQFDGTTLPDALRRAPGVTFVPSADSGDGTTIMVRGMSGAFNVVTLNGVQLSSSRGVDRSPSFEGLLADSVSKITINKTLLPNQSGSGTGGLVEIETKGPLDRPARYVSLSAEGATTPRDFLSDRLFSGTASFKFGESQNFGISLSAQHRKQNRRNYSIGSQALLGKFLPAGATSIYDVDPRLEFPFEAGAADVYYVNSSVDVQNIANTTSSFVASAQWQMGDSTNLRFDYSRNKTKANYNQFNSSLYQNAGYIELPIDEIGGDSRYALVAEDYFMPGIIASLTNFYQTRQSEEKNDVFSFKGKTDLGTWQISYAAGFAQARFSEDGIGAGFGEPDSTYFNKSFSGNHLSADILNDTNAGKIISILGPARGSLVPLPQFTAAGADYAYDNAHFAYQGGNRSVFQGGSSRWNGSVDVKKNFDSNILKHVEFGVSYDRSRSSFDSYDPTFYFAPIPVSMSALGYTPRDIALSNIGQSAPIKLISERDMRQFYRDLRGGSNPLISSFEFPPNPDMSRDFVKEEKLAGYVQTFLQFGNFELISGIRIEQISPSAVTRYAPTIISENGIEDVAYSLANTNYLPFKGSNLNILPRAVLNFRPRNDIVIRLGYYRSIALPNLSDLSISRNFTLDLRPRYGASLNQPKLQIYTGNPGLKSSYTDNLDISFEWYSDQIGVLKAGAFYKPTKRSFMTVDLFEQNGLPNDIDLPDDPRFSTPNLFYSVVRPENSPFIAKLWGLELAVERQFDFLPGWLSGFGFFGNYTYTKSEMTISAYYAPAPGGRVLIENVPYAAQAPHSGTAALTYSKNNVSGTLSYTRQSSFASGLRSNGISSGLAAISSLDLKMQYSTKIGGASTRIYFEGSNLLKGSEDVSSSTSSFVDSTGTRIPTLDVYTGGRSFRLGLAVTF
ncbi:TonB-dependent receptor [Sphingopyxis fribergensis]